MTRSDFKINFPDLVKIAITIVGGGVAVYIGVAVAQTKLDHHTQQIKEIKDTQIRNMKDVKSSIRRTEDKIDRLNEKIDTLKDIILRNR